MYRIVNPHREHQQFRRSIQLAAIDKQLPQREINDVCRQLGYAWRTRQLPPDVLVRSMVYRLSTRIARSPQCSRTWPRLASLAIPRQAIRRGVRPDRICPRLFLSNSFSARPAHAAGGSRVSISGSAGPSLSWTVRRSQCPTNPNWSRLSDTPTPNTDSAAFPSLGSPS